MDKNLRKWLILLLGFVMMLCAGLIFSWSIFISPIENDLGFSRNSTSLVFTISLSVSILGQIIAGIITNKKSARLAFFLATFLLIIGFIGASFVESLYQLYLYYGIFCGLAIGIIYNAVTTVIASWFPDKTGAASGFLLMGFGMSGIVLGTLSAHIITLVGWRQTFIILAIIFTIITLIGSIFMKPPKESHEKSKNHNNDLVNIHPLKMVGKRSFMMFFCWCVFIASAALLIMGHAAPFAEDMGANIKTAALAAGVISVFNGLARVVFGKLYDTIGNRLTMQLITVTLGIGAIVILIAYNSASLSLLFVGYAIVGTGYGGNPPIVNSFIKEKYGLNYFGVNLGIANIHMALGSLIGPTIAASIKTNYGSYTPAIYIMLVFVLMALVISMKVIKDNKATS